MTLFKLKLRKMVVCGFRQGIGDLPETCYYWEMHHERITDLSQQPIQTEMCKLLVQNDKARYPEKLESTLTFSGYDTGVCKGKY